MVHPLSLLTYYRRNLSRVGIIVGILALAIFAVIGVASLTGSFKTDANRSIPFYQEYYTIFISANPALMPEVRSAALTLLNADKNHEYYLEGDVQIMKKESLVGNQQTPVVFLAPGDRDRFLKTVHLHLDQGALPAEGSSQIAMTNKLLSNREKKIGDVVGDQVEQFEFLPGKYTVSGSLQSDQGHINPEFLGIGSLSYITKQDYGSTTTFLIRPLDANRQALSDQIQQWRNDLKDRFPGSKINIETEYAFRQFIDDNFRFMDIMVGTIMGIITLVMTISVALFNVIVFMQRSSEFGLLLALGYTRGFVLRKTLMESLGQIVLSILLGVGLTALAFWALNHIFFLPNGFAQLTLWEIRNLYFALPLPLAVAFFAILTILNRITKLDPIAILERRD